MHALDWFLFLFFFNCMCIQFSEMEAHLFTYRYNFLQIYAQVCSTWTFCNSYLVTMLNRYFDSYNSCKNKEYLLIRQIFDRTLPIFWFSNVWLQHKNGQTCPMTHHYLHHWKIVYSDEHLSLNQEHIFFNSLELKEFCLEAM